MTKGDKKRVAVIGGGAAGMLAAGRIARGGCFVTLFERNSLLGKKLGITGKGRCNLTNDVPPEDFMKNVTKSGKFLFSAINHFSCRDTMDFFSSLGVKLKVERGSRVFPESDKAIDVVLALKKYLVDAGVEIKTERVTSLKAYNGKVTEIVTERSKYTGYDDVLLCTGGASYPLTGSTGDGFDLARALGHTVTEIMPSLVGLWSEDKLCRDTPGLSLKNVAIKVYNNEKSKVIYEDFGEMLFTHFGVSGPMILSASAHTRPMEKGRYTVFIDLKPALTPEQLDARVLSDFDKYKNKNFENSLTDLFPSKLVRPFIYMCGIAPDRKVNSITRAEREKIVSTMKALPVVISGFRPIDEAIITSGGVETKEIDPKTMRSKLVNNLYFAGEIIDVDAYTGGFNLQIAFSTAVTAADAIIGKE